MTAPAGETVSVSALPVVTANEIAAVKPPRPCGIAIERRAFAGIGIFRSDAVVPTTGAASLYSFRKHACAFGVLSYSTMWIEPGAPVTLFREVAFALVSSTIFAPRGELSGVTDKAMADQSTLDSVTQCHSES